MTKNESVKLLADAVIYLCNLGDSGLRLGYLLLSRMLKNFLSTVTFSCKEDMTVTAGVNNVMFSSSIIKSQPTLSDRLCTETKMTAQLVFETKPLQTHLGIYRYNVD